jgi:hypothetical protein
VNFQIIFRSSEGSESRPIFEFFPCGRVEVSLVGDGLKTLFDLLHRGVDVPDVT